jgi:hypothetical protein
MVIIFENRVLRKICGPKRRKKEQDGSNWMSVAP